MAKLSAAHSQYVLEVLIPAIEANMSQCPPEIIKWMKDSARRNGYKTTFNIKFSSENTLSETRAYLRESAAYLDYSEQDTLYWTLRETPHLIEGIEQLDRLIRTPALTFDIKKQLPIWYDILDRIHCMKKQKL